MRSKIKKITIIAAIVCLLGTNFIAASAAATSYTSYKLPKYRGNNYTALHNKATDKGYIHNRVTAITDASFANFWVVTSDNEKISDKYKQGVDTDAVKLLFDDDRYEKEDVEVGMGMENIDYSNKRGFVSGKVNFY